MPIYAQLFLQMGVLKDYQMWKKQWHEFMQLKIDAYELLNQWEDFKIDGSNGDSVSILHQRSIVIDMPVMDWIIEDLGQCLSQPVILSDAHEYQSWFQLWQQLDHQSVRINASVNRKMLLHGVLADFQERLHADLKNPYSAYANG